MNDFQARIDAFLAAKRPQTPCMVIDLQHVREQYRALQLLMPKAEICRGVF